MAKTVKIAHVARGPSKLKPTQVHKTKKNYHRKKVKNELRHIIKTALK